jgi:hypothetical protein
MKRYPSLIAEFEKDLNADTLPAVSWIIAPSSRSEHATNHPSGVAPVLNSVDPTTSSWRRVHISNFESTQESSEDLCEECLHFELRRSPRSNSLLSFLNSLFFNFLGWTIF